MSSLAILLAGGSGSRMRGSVQDKILEPILGVPVIAWSVKAFREAGVADAFVIVRRDDAQRDAILAALKAHGCGDIRIAWAFGGAERRDSVLNGLEACPAGTTYAFIHDSARPLVAPEALRSLATATKRDGAAVLAHRVADTVKQVPKGAGAGTPTDPRDLDRSTLWAMETPQAFSYRTILDAYRKVVADGVTITDDVAAATHAGHAVTLVENLSANPKITTPDDIAWVEFLKRR